VGVPSLLTCVSVILIDKWQTTERVVCILRRGYFVVVFVVKNICTGLCVCLCVQWECVRYCAYINVHLDTALQASNFISAPCCKVYSQVTLWTAFMSSCVIKSVYFSMVVTLNFSLKPIIILSDWRDSLILCEFEPKSINVLTEFGRLPQNRPVTFCRCTLHPQTKKEY